MFSEKLLVGALMLGWRLIRVLGLFALGGSRRPALAEETASARYALAPRRGGFGDALIWITVLALIVIGIPLASADPAFKAAAGHNLQALLQATNQVTGFLAGVVS